MASMLNFLKSLIILSLLGFNLGQSQGYAQEGEESLEENTVLSPNLWPSARASGLGGTLSSMADGMDAPYYNPAGIGGIHLDKKQSRKKLRFLGFPYLGAEAGENSVALQKELSTTEGGTTDGAVTQSIIDANAGKRQYGRAAIVPGFTVSRFTMNYIYDNQLAAVPLNDGSGLIRTKQQVSSGVGGGFSATDPKGRFYIGAYAASLQLTQLDADLSYGQMVDPELRTEALSESRTQYNGTRSHVGMLWRLSEKASPTIGLVARDVGGTTYTATDGSDPLLQEENMALSFAVSPKLGKWGFFNFSLEADHLGDAERAVEKKLRTGAELTIGGLFGSESGVGLQGGYNRAGGSYGVHANIGLIRLQAASYAEDIGSDNNLVTDRRYVGILSINVAH